jgi:hypothetical protein
MRMNARMHALLNNERLRALSIERTLPTSLQDIIDEGIHCRDGLWLLRAMDTGETNVTPSSFPDAVGYECFINHFHINDQLGNGVEDAPVEEQLAYGLRFVLDVQKRLPREPHFTIILSCNEDDCSVRVHAHREGQHWIADDLEDYRDDAVLVIGSLDPTLSSTLLGLPA